MSTRKPLSVSCLVTACAAIVVLGLPCPAGAVSIGEITLQSRLGEPLLARVSLAADAKEEIDGSCVSLVVPDVRHEEDVADYLTRADLAVKTEGQRLYVQISTRKPIDAPFIRMLLQVKCPGTGSVVKELTALPDLALPALQVSPAAAPAPAQTEVMGARPSAPGKRGAQHEGGIHVPAKTASPAPGLRPRVGRADIKQRQPGVFRLKLSGEPLDFSRVGKISPEERAFLLERQKLLDVDDQMANFLALQHQVKQLQDELAEIKSQLKSVGVNLTASAVAAAQSVAAPAVASATPSAPVVPVAQPRPAPAKKPVVVQQENPYLQNGLLAALALVLAILALWQGLRYYTRIKSRVRDNAAPGVEPAAQAASVVAAPPRPAATSVGTKPSSDAVRERVAAVTAPAAAVMRNVGMETPAALQQADDEAGEEDLMFEEAGLYAAHGRTTKAIEILQEVVKRFPAKVEAWSLLLSIYSALGEAERFEKAARAFLRYHKDNPSWSGIQALGRTLDKDNLLYVDNNSRIAANPLLPEALISPRPIGDILMEMGVLSEQDLHNCLDEFDPKKHGRFGGYLVSRKVITFAQLDQALLLQQGIGSESHPGDLPSLKQMENFLSDFDPKRDGTIGDFLAARNAVTPEQLSNLLQPQQAGHDGLAVGVTPSVADDDKPLELPSLQDMENLMAGFDPTRDGSLGDFLAARKDGGESGSVPPVAGDAAVPVVQTAAPLNFDKGDTLDFVLESTSKNPVFDLEFEPQEVKDKKPLDLEFEPSSGKDKKPLDFEIDSPTLDFPKIDLDLGIETPADKKTDKQ